MDLELEASVAEKGKMPWDGAEVGRRLNITVSLSPPCSLLPCQTSHAPNYWDPWFHNGVS